MIGNLTSSGTETKLKKTLVYSRPLDACIKYEEDIKMDVRLATPIATNLRVCTHGTKVGGERAPVPIVS